MMAAWICFKRIDYVRDSFALLWSQLQRQQLAMKYKSQILDFVDFLWKWRRRLSAKTESWFSWFVDVDWLKLLFQLFWDHIDIKSRLEKIFSSLMKSRTSYVYPHMFLTAFPDLGLKNIVISNYLDFLGKRSTVLSLQKFIEIRNAFSDVVDFDSSDMQNIKQIKEHFKFAANKLNIELLESMISIYSAKLDIAPILSDVFWLLLCTAYNRALDFHKYIENHELWEQVKKWFLFRFRNRDFRFAKLIYNKFWTALDLDALLEEGIEIIRNDGFVLDFEKIKRDFKG